MIKTKPKLVCPECESKTILTNTNGIRRCRRCGCQWKKEDQKDKK